MRNFLIALSLVSALSACKPVETYSSTMEVPNSPTFRLGELKAMYEAGFSPELIQMIQQQDPHRRGDFIQVFKGFSPEDRADALSAQNLLDQGRSKSPISPNDSLRLEGLNPFTKDAAERERLNEAYLKGLAGVKGQPAAAEYTEGFVQDTLRKEFGSKGEKAVDSAMDTYNAERLSAINERGWKDQFKPTETEMLAGMLDGPTRSSDSTADRRTTADNFSADGNSGTDKTESGTSSNDVPSGEYVQDTQSSGGDFTQNTMP